MMTLWENYFQHANYYLWKALRGHELDFQADPITGTHHLFCNQDLKRELGVVSSKALFRFWLRKATLERERIETNKYFGIK